jgi:uncharacterized protein
MTYRGTFKNGVVVLENAPSKEWSLVDCISFDIMQKSRINQALSADHHFEQAGFSILLR